MIENLSRGKRNIALGLLAILLLWFSWNIRSVLNPVILGYLCAFILTPVVLSIERRGFSRLTAVNLTFAAGFVGASLVALVMSLQVLELVSEVRQSVAEAQGSEEAPPNPESSSEQPLEDAAQSASTEAAALAPAPNSGGTLHMRVERRLVELQNELDRWGLNVDIGDANDLYKALGELAQARKLELFGAAGSGARLFLAFLGRLLNLAGMFLLLPLYAYYFLFVQKDLHQYLESCLPKDHRKRIMSVAQKIGEVVASFFRGRLSVSLIKGLLISIGLSLFGVEYAFLLGMVSGLLSVVPFIGPLLGFLVTFAIDVPMHPEGTLFGFATHGIWPSLVRCAIVFGIAELIEGYVLVPRILGDSLGLHPLVVFVALLAGGAALGTLGILIALPLTAVLVILFKEFVQPAIHDFAEE